MTKFYCILGGFQKSFFVALFLLLSSHQIPPKLSVQISLNLKNSDHNFQLHQGGLVSFSRQQPFSMPSFQLNHFTQEHIATHSNAKMFSCYICGKGLKNDSCYRRHMVCVHGLKHTCDLCGKDFSSPVGLKHHRRGAHGILF